MNTYCILKGGQAPSSIRSGDLKTLFPQSLPQPHRNIRFVLILLATILFHPTGILAATITLTSIKDTYVDQNKPTTQYGSSTTVAAQYGLDTTWGRWKMVSPTKETLIQFDLSPIPRDAQITAAYLRLYSNYNRSFRKDTATRAYAIMRSWSESTTWTTQPLRASSYEDSIAVTNTNQYFEWNITSLVQDWINGAEANYGVMVRSEGGGSLYFNSRENSSNKPILYVEYNVPTSTPQPTPTPTPTSFVDDTGISNAPTTPANLVTKTVCASGCDYSTIQAAVDGASAGWTIQVKNGTYSIPTGVNPVVMINNKSGTQASPITLMAYPGHSPIIECETSSPWAPPSASFGLENGITISNSSWWIIDGFEIKHCSWGIRPFQAHSVTIRNNHIHHNGADGIITAISDNLYISYNEIHHNGIPESGVSASFQDRFCNISAHRFCHGIYVGGKTDDGSTTGCSTYATTLRGNYVHDHHGFGAHIWSNNTCQERASILVENNLFVDNLSGGFEIAKNYLGNIYVNNTTVLVNPPQPAAASPYGEYGALAELQYAISPPSPQNNVRNNIFYLGITSFTVVPLSNVNGTNIPAPMYALILRDWLSHDANIVNNNLWYVVPGASWIDMSGTVKDFAGLYASSTGYDAQGVLWRDPLFRNLSSRDFHLQSSSPAIGAGNMSFCSVFDKDKNARGSRCDIGAYQYIP
ncbi:MAG: hypothetical protein C4291_09085 [Candidatus Dadabacteria bacterium]